MAHKRGPPDDIPRRNIAAAHMGATLAQCPPARHIYPTFRLFHLEVNPHLRSADLARKWHRLVQHIHHVLQSRHGPLAWPTSCNLVDATGDSSVHALSQGGDSSDHSLDIAHSLRHCHHLNDLRLLGCDLLHLRRPCVAHLSFARLNGGNCSCDGRLNAQLRCINQNRV